MYIAEAGEKNDGNHHCPIFLVDGWVVSAEKEAGGGQMYKHIFFTLSKIEILLELVFGMY